MQLYDFSIYAARRDAVKKENAAVARVVEAMEHIEEPGAVKQLKDCVDDWFILHRKVLAQHQA